MCTCLHTGTVVEAGLSIVTYNIALTPVPIKLTCNVTGVVVWRVNNKYYTLTDLSNRVLPDHSRTGTNILVYRPLNNTEYVCVSTTNNGDVSSDPAYLIIIGE